MQQEERLWEAFRQNEIEVERRPSLTEGDVALGAETSSSSAETRHDEAYLIDFVPPCRQGNVAILCGGAGPLGEGSALRERPAADYGLVAADRKVLRLRPQQIEDSLDKRLTLVREAMAQEGDLRKGLGYSSAMGQNSPCADE